jgi:branched-chain amino acid transport system substrate-binding protein
VSLKGRSILVTAIVALTGMALAACGASGSNGGDTVIAAPLALTGPSGSVGLDVQQGAQLAVDELNKQGGIGGHQISLAVQDTTGQPAQAVQLVTSFARDKRVVGILGPINAAEVGAVTGIAESSKIVVLPPASSGAVPGIEHGRFNDWTFRLNQAIPLTVGPQMTKVVGLTGAKSVTVLNYDDNAAYVDTGDRWAQAAQAAGAGVQRIQFPSTTQDFSSIVTKIPASSGLIAIGALPATDAQLVRAIRQAGLNAPIMGDSSMLTSEVFDGSRGASEGAYAYSTYLPDGSQAAVAFTKAFQDAYRKPPTSINAFGYEAVMLMAHAAGNGAPTRDAIREGLSRLTDYQGVTGVLSYAGSGDAHRSSIPLVRIGPGGVLQKAGDIVPLDGQ